MGRHEHSVIISVTTAASWVAKSVLIRHRGSPLLVSEPVMDLTCPKMLKYNRSSVRSIHGATIKVVAIGVSGGWV
jgi:hypothetical protein